jgi:hypothetical protein
MEIRMPRQLIEPHKGGKRYVRRKKGKFTTKQVKVGRSLAADRRSKSKTVVKKGEGDRGDQRREIEKKRRAAWSRGAQLRRSPGPRSAAKHTLGFSGAEGPFGQRLR